LAVIVIILIIIFFITRTEDKKGREYSYIGLEPLMPNSDITLNERSLNTIRTMKSLSSTSNVKIENISNKNNDSDSDYYSNDENNNSEYYSTDNSEYYSTDDSEYYSIDDSKYSPRKSNYKRKQNNNDIEMGISKNKLDKGKEPRIIVPTRSPINSPRKNNIEEISTIETILTSELSDKKNIDDNSSSSINVFRPSSPPPINRDILPIYNYIPPSNKPKKIREGECRRILEKIYKKPFPSCWPEFLRNPESNNKLELDCYNEELAIALEHNGEQHYNYPNGFHKTQEEFIKQVRRDKFKREMCEREGIYLIQVPYHIPFKQLEKFIRENLPDESIILD
jgi:hypothetical protein